MSLWKVSPKKFTNIPFSIYSYKELDNFTKILISTVIYQSWTTNFRNLGWGEFTLWAFTCSKLAIETLEQGVKNVQS